MPSGFFNWSKTAGTNATADSSIQWQEGQAPSSVNDSARAMMARLAEFRDDTGGAIITTGTATAYVAATSQGFVSLALLDRKSITIVPHLTSGNAPGTSPTLSIDGLSARPLRCAPGAALSAGAFVAGTPYSIVYYDAAGEFICEGAGIADGAISNANIAAGAVTGGKIAANTITSGNMAAGSIGAAAVAPSFVPVSTCMLNGTIGFVQGGGNMSIFIKTLAGADPSVADPVTFIFRDGDAGDGNYFVRTMTSAATSAIVIPANQPIGFLNNLPGRLWLLALDVGGTVELALFNACKLLAGTPAGITNIFPLHGWGMMATQPISSAPLAGVGYSQIARAAVYVPLGYLSWETGGLMGVAGTWNVAPSRIQIFQPGTVPLPGMMVQQVYGSVGVAGSGSNPIPHDNTIPQSGEGDQYMSLSITPSSSANALIFNAAGHFSSGATANIVMALFQGAPNPLPNALAASTTVCPTTTVMQRLVIDHQMQAGTLTGTAFNIRAGAVTGTITFNGETGAALSGGAYGGSLNSNMRITEVMV